MAKGLMAGLLLLLSIPSFADSRVVDSLKSALAHAQTDTAKIALLIKLSREIPAGDSTHKLGYARQALTLARQAGYPKYLMDSYENLGQLYCFGLKDYHNAIVY